MYKRIFKESNDVVREIRIPGVSNNSKMGIVFYPNSGIRDELRRYAKTTDKSILDAMIQEYQIGVENFCKKHKLRMFISIDNESRHRPVGVKFSDFDALPTGYKTDEEQELEVFLNRKHGDFFDLILPQQIIDKYKTY